MKILLLSVACLAVSTSASAGTLKSCEGVSTSQGYMYVGTYCFDFACTYTFTRTFHSYCPYNSD
jgi:hypothetical protein